MSLNRVKADRVDGAASVCPGRLQRWVEAISYPRSFRGQPRANRQAGEWVADLLSSFGYSVKMQGDYRNVVAYPRGHRGPIALAGAHYDSVPTTPGADDNGSGLAVLLETARALANEDCVGFVAFNAEEDGLVGSSDFVADHQLHGLHEIRGIHVMEMVGFTATGAGSQRSPAGLPIQLPEDGDFIGVVGNDRSVNFLKTVEFSARKMNDGPRIVSLGLRINPERWLPDILRSDHAPFWRADIPALMWSDTAEFRNPNYHRSTDTPDTLDYLFMERVCRLLINSLQAFPPPL
ncbi:MAG: M28 family peptidase [Myxococcota bacterium]